MKTDSFPPSAHRSGFSLVEVLVAVALIGIITFLAFPNIVAVKEDSEKSLAIARAEAINMAVSSLIQSQGRVQATTAWAAASSDQNKYALINPYLAYAPTTVTEFMPTGYTLEFPNSLAVLSKVKLWRGATEIIY
ncbi:MAG: prepilin-type N-terminal cleavage/methylation domain-containing protein [Verrucomicrobiota bacterium]